MNSFTMKERLFGWRPVNLMFRFLAIGSVGLWWFEQISPWWILPAFWLAVESDAKRTAIEQESRLGRRQRRRSFKSAPIDGRETYKDASFWVRRVGHPMICFPLVVLSGIVLAGTGLHFYEHQVLPSYERAAIAAAAFVVFLSALSLHRLRRRWLKAKAEHQAANPDLNAAVEVLTPSYGGADVADAMARLPAHLQALIHEGPVIEGQVTRRSD